MEKPAAAKAEPSKEKKQAENGKKDPTRSGFKKGEFRKKEFHRPLKQGDDPALVLSLIHISEPTRPY